MKHVSVWSDGCCVVQEATARHTAGETRQRIFDLLITPSISWRLLFQFAPVAVRRMFMSEHELAASPVQVSLPYHRRLRALALPCLPPHMAFTIYPPWRHVLVLGPCC